MFTDDELKIILMCLDDFHYSVNSVIRLQDKVEYNYNYILLKKILDIITKINKKVKGD